MKQLFQKPWVYVIQASFAIAVLAFMFLLCRQEKTIDVDAGEVMDTVLAAVPEEAERMQEGDALTLRTYYDLNANDYISVAIYTPVSNMNVDEIVIIHRQSSDQTEAIEEAFDGRISDLTEKFQNYGEDQMVLIQASRCYSYGDYTICVISSQTDTIIRTFRQCVKGTK